MTTKMFDPDQFIAGIRTAETTVTVFQRADLAGRLMAIEADLALIADDDSEERDMTAGAEKAELLEKRAELQAELEDSAVQFVVRAIDSDEVDKIAKEARKACSEKADEAAKEAAAIAREDCRRAEIGDKNDIREAVRRAAANASSAVIQSETGYYVMSAAIVTEDGDRAFTPEQMRVVADKLGTPQIENIKAAFYNLTSTDPGSFVPKSQRPGRMEED